MVDRADEGSTLSIQGRQCLGSISTPTLTRQSQCPVAMRRRPVMFVVDFWGTGSVRSLHPPAGGCLEAACALKQDWV